MMTHSIKIGKVHRLYVPVKKVRQAKLRFISKGIFIFEGRGSFYLPSLRLKYLDEARVRDWVNLDGEVYPMLAGEAARMELKRAFPDLRKVGWRGASKSLFSKTNPMYCLKGGRFEGAYVDLKAAYWQIYRNLWLDSCYPRGAGVLSLRGVANRLEHWKVARNAVIGVVISRTAEVFSDGIRKTIYPDNPFLSPHLWATIVETLNGIATVAKSCSAVYCMTDGYIFEDQRGAKVFLDWLEDLGVSYRVSWGDCHIKGWTSYSVPTRTTKHYQKGYDRGIGFESIKSDFTNPFDMPDFVFKKARFISDKQESAERQLSARDGESDTLGQGQENISNVPSWYFRA